MLDFVSSYIGTIFPILAGLFFGCYILKEKIKINKFALVLSVLLGALIMEFLFLLNVPVVKIIVGYFLYLVLYKIIFDLSISKAVLLSLIFYVLLFIGETLLFILLGILFQISGNNLYLLFGASFFSNLMVTFFCIVIMFIFRKLLSRIVIINIKKTLVVFWFISFAVSISFLFVIVFVVDLGFNMSLILSMIIIVLMIILISFLQVYKNNELAIKYDKLLEFIKKYELEIDNQRILRHETKNQLLMIKSKLLDCDDKNNISKYIDEVIKDNNRKIRHSEYAKLRYLPSNGIKGLFYFKVSEAIDKKINVDIRVSKNIENSFLYTLNSLTFNQLGKILGIFLDNAIEASVDSDKKNIGIEIYLNGKEMVFIISNTYSGKINTNHNFFRFSSKGEGRGHGLLLAKTIINSNSNFSNEVIITDSLYTQKLLIKK